MKFARYLQDTQTPEWEKAYIDYGVLKAQLAVIRAKAPLQVDALRSFGNGGVDYIHRTAPIDEEKCDNTREAYFNQGITISAARWRNSNQQLHPSPRLHFPPVSPFPKDPKSPTRSPLQAILSSLPANHIKLFDMIDAELDKVEKFYTKREEEMHGRFKLLRKELNELGKHRQLFHESSAHSKTLSWAKRMYTYVSDTSTSMIRWISGRNSRPEEIRRSSRNVILGDRGLEFRIKNVVNGEEKYSGTSSSVGTVGGVAGHPLDPREYEHAKKRLRKAIIEHYRGLEVLNNYRILNLTGFRKLLRKYGKITRIPIVDAYMKERVEPSAFASGAMVSTMLKEMEHLFAARFERGSKKRAINHLRVGPVSKTHHFTAFRSGLWLGLAFAAIAGGCYLSFQQQTRESLPSWDILLFIYSIFLVPVLLALLIGLNIFVWVRNRINYVFIFKLNSRSRLDYREYFELPSFFLCTLAYAFLFSLAQIGPPMLWPLVWLVLALSVMLNPMRNSMGGQARWWTIKKIIKLGVSGIWTVEFADLWLGDQFCSLGYSLANLYFSFFTSFRTLLSSAYDPQAQEAWLTCGVSQNWGWSFLLGMLPFLARFLQSLRRYWDSKLPSQLINAGKYGAGMIQYLLYFYWRHQMSPRTGKSYVLFCFAATVNSLYGCVWDYCVDWSMCKPYAQYPLLRPELVYKSRISLYYLTMLCNLCIRFVWLIYLFDDGNNIEVYAFIAAMMEMLRRVLWNFYRLENKHLSNMCLYRVTRELPLPYGFEVDSKEDVAQLQSRKRMARLS